MGWNEAITYLQLVLFVGPTAILILMLLHKGIVEIWKLFRSGKPATGELSLQRTEALEFDEGDLTKGDIIVVERCDDSSSPATTACNVSKQANHVEEGRYRNA